MSKDAAASWCGEAAWRSKDAADVLGARPWAGGVEEATAEKSAEEEGERNGQPQSRGFLPGTVGEGAGG